MAKSWLNLIGEPFMWGIQADQFNIFEILQYEVIAPN